MTKRTVGSMMGVVVLGLLSSGCAAFLNGPPLAGLGPNWQPALNADLQQGAARAAASIEASGVNAHLLWVGSHEVAMHVVRGPTGIPVAQEAQVVYAVEYPATKHCFWETGVVRRQNTGGASYGPPVVMALAGPHEPIKAAGQGPLVCDAVNTVQGGVRAPFN